MRALIVLCIFLFALFTAGCNKAKPLQDSETSEFLFNAQKNGKEWKVKAVKGYYNTTEKSYDVIVEGKNGENLGLSFIGDPLATGKLEDFNFDINVIACPLCASLSARYTLDRSKSNRFEIIGFDKLQNLIIARFNLTVKRERIYDDEDFMEESAIYEGLFRVRYEDLEL